MNGSETIHKSVITVFCWLISGTLHQNNDISKHASAHLMDEVVYVWQLAVMMPYLCPMEKESLKQRFEVWNSQIVEAAKKGSVMSIFDTTRVKTGILKRKKHTLISSFSGPANDLVVLN